MSFLQDELMVAQVITTAQTFNFTNDTQHQHNIGLLLRATAITTNLTLAVLVSTDGSNYVQVYTSPAMTGVPRIRRVIFSIAGSGSYTDSTATADLSLNLAPIIEPYYRVVVTPSGSCTVNLDHFRMDTAK